MTERIWTKKQYGKLSRLQKKYLIPEAVVEEVHGAVDVLDTYYGSERDVDKDDGGCVFLILSEPEDRLDGLYSEILEKYHMRKDDAEFRCIVWQGEKVRWHSDLFIASNDYGIQIVYCTEIERRK